MLAGRSYPALAPCLDRAFSSAQLQVPEALEHMDGFCSLLHLRVVFELAPSVNLGDMQMLRA